MPSADATGEHDDEHPGHGEAATVLPAPEKQAPVKPVQNPLTPIMPIADDEAYQQLNQTLQQVQSLPNPIVIALNQISTVHFARFVFLENNTRLAVITTYDGDFEKYIMDFVDAIGDIFNLLLKFMADSPPLPLSDTATNSSSTCARMTLPCSGPMYSAYPAATVLDIRAAPPIGTP